MTVLLSLLALGTGLLHIRAEYRGPRAQVYLFKPLTTVLLVLIAALAPVPVVPFYRGAVVLGLLCSLAGDVFLMLPTDRFLAGLVSFLLAHLCYIAAFAWEAGFVFPVWSLLPFLLYGLLFLRVLWPHAGALRGPVLVYGLVIVVMAWQAFVFWQQTHAPGALPALLGAVLFVVSDSVLAYRRFVHSFKTAQAVIMATYYAAQWLIALSV